MYKACQQIRNLPLCEHMCASVEVACVLQREQDGTCVLQHPFLLLFFLFSFSLFISLSPPLSRPSPISYISPISPLSSLLFLPPLLFPLSPPLSLSLSSPLLSPPLSSSLSTLLSFLYVGHSLDIAPRTTQLLNVIKMR